ncbi:MAG: molybdopterin-dependent oxidoreductase [Holophagales bacterium]|nr:molybdopterin-dependent oxidoreductase [Holophagales bacterium]
MGDSPRLPPGQIETRKFPVVGEKAPSPHALDLGSWRLEIHGEVARPATLRWHELQALDLRERRVDIHCVTGWSRLGNRITGVPLAEVLEPVGVRRAARFVRFEAYSERRHDTSLPLDLALEDTWLVTAFDGRPLEVEHGFPLRTVTPSRYFYKSLKWLHRIELIAEDALGYWERESSYHNQADPWPGDQRFTSGSLRPEQARRFRDAQSFDRWRGKVLLGLDLRAWQPRSRDLRGLQLKNCDLRGADLAGCDLSGANLSLSDLRGADCRRMRARGADLEGADFTGADLGDADLAGSALSATRFHDPETGDGAAVEGLGLEGATGLLGSQERWLASRPVSGR